MQKALKEINFTKVGKHFKHKDCQFYIEFVSPPIAIGDEPIQDFEYYKTSLGTIKMLTPTDSVKDRLASYYYWDDLQGLEQAIDIYQEIPNKVDVKEIKRWSEKEKKLEKYKTFLSRIKKL